MNPTLHHIALKVRNLERCEQFYTEVLGLHIMQRHREQNGSLRSLWFDLGGVILMLERCEGITAAGENRTSASPTEMGLHLLALTITAGSRAEWQDKLRHAGVHITGETPFSIYFRDTENNRLALSHYPDRAPGTRNRPDRQTRPVGLTAPETVYTERHDELRNLDEKADHRAGTGPAPTGAIR